jgi:hypothetical protein
LLVNVDVKVNVTLVPSEVLVVVMMLVPTLCDVTVEKMVIGSVIMEVTTMKVGTGNRMASLETIVCT